MYDVLVVYLMVLTLQYGNKKSTNNQQKHFPSKTALQLSKQVKLE